MFQSLSSFIILYAGLLCVKLRNMYLLFVIYKYVLYTILLYVLPGNGDILFHIVYGSGHRMMYFTLCLAGFFVFLSFIFLSI